MLGKPLDQDGFMAHTTGKTEEDRLPERLYLALGILFGLLFTFLIPPFQAPDEATHLLKALQLSEGRIFGQLENGIPGGRFSSTWGDYLGLFGDLPGHPEKKAAPQTWKTARSLSLDHKPKVFFDYRNTVLYTPIPYLPQSTGILVADWLDLPPFYWMYLGRLFNLAAGIALVFAAIRLAPTQKWLLTSVALMPMTVFLNATMSADVVTTGLCFLFSAWVLRERVNPGTLSAGTLAGISAIATLIALSKQVYFPIALIVFLIPTSRFRDHRSKIVFYLSSVVLGPLLSTLWTMTLKHRHLFLRMAERPEDVDVQLKLILNDPWGYLGILFHTLKISYLALLEQFIGLLGWLDTALPSWQRMAYAFLLGILAFTDCNPNFRIGWKEKTWISGLLATCVFLLFLALYLQASPIGADSIGCQGRYFIPLAPLFFLLASHSMKGLQLTRYRLTRIFLALALTASLVETGILLLKRYHAA